MLKRKIYDELVAWKSSSNGTTAMMIDGARRVGKSYIAEAFAKAEYKSYILIDFGRAPTDVLDLFTNDSVHLRFFSSVAGGDGGVNCANQRSRPRSFCFTSSTDPQALSYSMSVMSPAL